MSNLRKHTPHRVTHKSLQVGRKSKLGEYMADSIGDAGAGRRESQLGWATRTSSIPGRVMGSVDEDCARTGTGESDRCGMLGRMPLR